MTCTLDSVSARRCAFEGRPAFATRPSLVPDPIRCGIPDGFALVECSLPLGAPQALSWIAPRPPAPTSPSRSHSGAHSGAQIRVTEDCGVTLRSFAGRLPRSRTRSERRLRPRAHPRHVASALGRAPQGRAGASLTRDCRHHPRHLLARHPSVAGGGGADRGVGARRESRLRQSSLHELMRWSGSNHGVGLLHQDPAEHPRVGLPSGRCAREPDRATGS